MTQTLQQYFPQIKTRAVILAEINSNPKLAKQYYSWKSTQRELFLDMCTGIRGVKALYDSFFKALFDGNAHKERLENLLSILLHEKVKILQILPLESNRITDESALMIMDIVVQLEDNRIANVECQRIGYMFPGQRAACYSADLLMRQYRRVKEELGKQFTYKNIQKVYTIIFFEDSPAIFKKDKNNYIHYSSQQTNTGVEIELLQEYIFTTLDIFQLYMQNKPIQNEQEAWLMFLSTDDPQRILELIQAYPKFKEMYNDIYTICCNTERVMEMFSEELKILDDNTVQYMIDFHVQQHEKDQQLIAEKDQQISLLSQQLSASQKEIAASQKETEKCEKEIAKLKTLLSAQKNT